MKLKLYYSNHNLFKLFLLVIVFCISISFTYAYFSTEFSKDGEIVFSRINISSSNLQEALNFTSYIELGQNLLQSNVSVDVTTGSSDIYMMAELKFGDLAETGIADVLISNGYISTLIGSDYQWKLSTSPIEDYTLRYYLVSNSNVNNMYRASEGTSYQLFSNSSIIIPYKNIYDEEIVILPDGITRQINLMITIKAVNYVDSITTLDEAISFLET